MHSCCSRRRFLTLISAAAVSSAFLAADSRPKERIIAGVRLPASGPSSAAEAFSRSACPPFLFNHCMRTYIFGALHARHHGTHFDEESAFVAAALHDLGLLKAYEQNEMPFEVDSANAAEDFAKRHGLGQPTSRRIWDAVLFHDMRWSIVSRQSPEAIVVAAGAAADVIGPDPEMYVASDVMQVVQAYPRLSFKKSFQSLLTGHCERQPASQTGTWLDGYCSYVNGNSRKNETAQEIDHAPFSE